MCIWRNVFQEGFVSEGIQVWLCRDTFCQPKDSLNFIEFAEIETWETKVDASKGSISVMPDRKRVTWRMKELLLVSWRVREEKRFNTSGNRKKLCTWANRHWSRVSRRKSLFVRRNVFKLWCSNFLLFMFVCIYLDLRSALIFDVDDAWAEASEFAPKANKKPSKWKEAKRQLKKGSSSDKTFIIKVEIKTWAASTLRKMHYYTRCRGRTLTSEPFKVWSITTICQPLVAHKKKSFADFAWYKSILWSGNLKIKNV